MGRKLTVAALIVMLLLTCPPCARALGFDGSETGSISIRLADPPVPGAQFELYHIASVDMDEAETLRYAWLPPFEDCGIPLDDPQLPAKLSAFLREQSIPAPKITTDDRGEASCGGLPLGLYFVRQVGAAEGFSACTPFLVTVPMQTETGLVYEVNASPKADIVRLICITVRKSWNTDGFAEHPDSVTVQLLLNGEVVDTALLTEQSGWQAEFSDLPMQEGYSIREVGIPKGYTATYTQNGWEFTVTNTPSLAQTGQLLWPIPVLTALGLGLLVLGFALLRKREGSDA